MNQDDDIEKLFSWLQTPDIHYREFAGAREVTDTVLTWQGRANTAGDLSRHEAAAPVGEGAPRPDDRTLPVEPVTPPQPSASAEPHDPTARPLDSVFGRLSGGRSAVRDPHDPKSPIPGLGSPTGRPR